MSNEYKLYVGIDWATEAHQICVLSPERNILEERQVEHSGPGIRVLLDWLGKLSGDEPASVAIAIELPRGALVESLAERGFHVFAINPKQLDRFRDRHTVAGAKDDRRDAFVLADSVRTDRPCFRQVRIDDPLLIQIREISRTQDDLREELNRLSNRLREQLHRYYPQLLRLSPSANEPWLWALVELAPTPAEGARLRPRRIERLLREHRIRKLRADGVVAELREPAPYVAPGTVEAASGHVRLLLPHLRLALQQRSACAQQLQSLLDALENAQSTAEEVGEHRDVRIILSFPGIATTVAATMLAEASQPLAERDRQALRALSGTAPITRRSGKHRMTIMRYACNGRLRNAVYHWARVASQHDDRARALYAELRRRGHTHGRALRQLADRLLAVLVAALRSRTLYDRNHASRVPAGSLQLQPAG